MNKLELLRTFVRVSELSSFTLAADSLGLPRSTVSEQVRALEHLLGTRLFNRTTRRVQATQDGTLLYERSKDLLSGMDEIESLFRADDAELAGCLRVDMPTMMARRVIIPALPQFLSRFPRLEVEISCTDRQVDLLREGFDCVMRIGALSDLDVVARPVGQLSMRNCASPAYLARCGVPQTLDDLAEHRLVHYVRNLGARSAGFEYVQAGQVCFQPMAGAVTVNNAEAYSAACLAGLGLIQVPAVGVAHHLASGELVEVMHGWQAQAMPVSLLYARQRHVPRRVQAFMGWLGGLLASQVDPLPSDENLGATMSTWARLPTARRPSEATVACLACVTSVHLRGYVMAITSQDICSAADQLNGFVGFHGKRGVHIVRFSEDAFGMDVADDSITPCSEFVWRPQQGARMALCRERLALLLEQHVDDRLNIGEPLRIYLRRSDLPEIVAERSLR